MFFQHYRQKAHYPKAAADPIDIIGLFAPENQEEEMERWLASPSKSYNPQFVYDDRFAAKHLRLLKHFSQVVPQIIKYYDDSSDWRAIVTCDYLTNLRADINATYSLLHAFLHEKVIDHDNAIAATNQLFGTVTPAEYQIARDLILHPVSDVIKNQLIVPNERHRFSQKKLESVVHTFLHDCSGILTAEEADQLNRKEVNSEQLAKILENVIYYMVDHAAGDFKVHVELLTVDNTDHFGIITKPLHPYDYSVIAPRLDKLHEGKLSAADLLRTIAHEINSHLRSEISTDTLIEYTSPHFRPDIVTRTQRSLVQEGFATLNGDFCLSESTIYHLDPMLILIPAYIREGHNFAETVKFAYDAYGIDPDVDNLHIHHDIWTFMQCFYGCRDTSAHSGYVLPWQQVYFVGPLRTLREIVRIDQDNFEEPLSLMRYSEFPFEVIREINHLEKQLGHELAPDPFKLWDFANPTHSCLTPTEYCKQLLLDL